MQMFHLDCSMRLDQHQLTLNTKSNYLFFFEPEFLYTIFCKVRIYTIELLLSQIQFQFLIDNRETTC